MKLYLVRHGDYSTNNVKQQDVLTEKGTKEIEQMVNFLKPLHVHVSHLFHSGKWRAQQTAEILAQGLICKQPIEAQKGLDPNDEVTGFENELQGDDDICLVGHLPFMSRLVSYLITGNENKEIVFFHTGTIVCLARDERTRWLIQWMWSPID